MNYHVKMAIQFGAPVEAAYAMASYYPARHAHVDPLVGSIAPGRYADVVLLTSVKDVAIKEVFCNGKLAAQDGKYILPVPKIDWPAWATDTINIRRKIVAKDFEILAPHGRATVEAAIQTPRYTAADQKYVTLPVIDGVVQRDIEHDIIKVADIDRYFGKAAMGKMFWSGLGPKTADSALATSVSHDLHEIAVFGTSDEAMAVAVNKLVELNGGIVLVSHGQVVSSMRLEIGGLMTCRPIADAAANLEQLYSAADGMEWIGNPGFPRGAIGSLITCSPYTWRLVIPYPGNPDGLVSIKTGEVMPVIR
jgi:adenine deaminase